MAQDAKPLTDDQLRGIAQLNDSSLLRKLTDDERGRLDQLLSGSVPRPGALARFTEPILGGIEGALGFAGDTLHSLLPTEGGKEARLRVGRAVLDPLGAEKDKAVAAFNEGRPLASLAHGAASVIPFVGPATVQGIEQIQSGDVAGGAGTLTATAAPFLVGPALKGMAKGGVEALKGTSAGEAMATGAERASNKGLTDVMGPKVGANKARFNNMAADVAPEIAREPGLNAFSREGLHAKVGEKLMEAQSGLDEAHDTRLVSQQVKTGPVLSALDEQINQLTAHPVEGSRVIPAAGASGPEARPLGQPVEPQPNATQIATLKQIRSEIAQLGPVAPYESLRRIRQAWDQVANVKYMPSTMQDALKAQGDATGAAKATGAVREALAKTDPTSAEAYARYHLLKTADDVMQATQESERGRPRVGRAIMARATGAMVGAQEGGAIGAGIGAIVGGIADRASQMAPSFQIMIARRLAGVADMLRNGDEEGARATLDTTIRRFPITKGTVAKAAWKVSVLGGRAEQRAARSRDEEDPSGR